MGKHKKASMKQLTGIAAKKRAAGGVSKETISIPIHDTQGKKVGSHTHSQHAGNFTQGGIMPGATPLAPKGVTNLPTPYPGAVKS